MGTSEGNKTREPQALSSLMNKRSGEVPKEREKIYIEVEKGVIVENPVYIAADSDPMSLDHLAEKKELAAIEDKCELLLKEIHRVDAQFQPMGESMAESLQIALDKAQENKQFAEALGRHIVAMKASSNELEASYQATMKNQNYMNIGLGLLASIGLLSHLI